MHEQVWRYIADPANQRLLLYIFIALIAGFLAGRYLGKGRSKGMPFFDKGDSAFFKGIQYLLSDDPDHAIEEFIKSVQINSDTIETYAALGNLYRSKGAIDRAIHIRRSIILRPNIDEETKVRALFDLGLDYKRGGFLDRALETFLNVIKKRPSDIATLEELEKIYEEVKDWENAFETRERIAKLSKTDCSGILAHHRAEAGKALFEQGDATRAKAYLKKAITINKQCIDAYLHLGDIYFSTGDTKEAMATWKKIVGISPQFTFLAYQRLEQVYNRSNEIKQIEGFLKDCARYNTDAFTHLALARYMYREKKHEEAIDELKKALDYNPHFWEARRLMGEILLETGNTGDALNAYNDLLMHLNVPYLEFQCTNCGFHPATLKWQCPQCKKWDTITLTDTGFKKVNGLSTHEMLLAESYDRGGDN
jgi:lipopolysaccharide biosynthesis regulator YciM